MQSIRTWLLGAIGTAAILGASALAVHAEGIGKPRVAHEDSYAISAPAPTSFSGCHFGGQVGRADGTLDAVGFGVSAYEWGVLAGCDLQIKQLVIGAFADYDWGNVNLAGATAKEWSFGGRAGVVVSQSTMIYALVNRPELTISAGSMSKTFDGIGVGGGIEVAIARNWRASLEYRHEVFDMTGGPSLDVDKVLGRVSFAIDWPAFR